MKENVRALCPERYETLSEFLHGRDMSLKNLNLQLARCLARRLRTRDRVRITRIVEHHDAPQPREYRLQNLQTFRCEITHNIVDAR